MTRTTRRSIDGNAAGRKLIETHSIDYIPLSERHGKVWHQGPFWFAGNFILLTLAAGFIGNSTGLSLGWSILAIVVGVCFGTFFMAFHANQGPRMGLPQMIQSRAQLGSRGAIFSLTAAVLVYVGFIVFNLILSTDALQVVLPGSKWFWYPVVAVVAVLIAVSGHDLLHFVQRWLTFILIAFYGVFTIYAIVNLGGQASVSHTGWTTSGFLTMFSVAAGYQITYAVYVSDYSRYLRKDTSQIGVIVWTYVGAAGSAIWLMSLGALLADRMANADAVSSMVKLGNEMLPNFGTVMVLISVPALIGIAAVNSYGAMLTGTAAVDGFRSVLLGVRTRVIGIVIIAVIAVAIALAIPDSYLGSFNNFITIVLYFLIPWTAVNLVDFYFIRHGRYAITEIFNRRGIYGQWPWRGLTAYTAAMVAMVPFMVVGSYVGPVAVLLGGADFSFLVGLVVAGLLYYLLNRNVDRSAEDRAIGASNMELDVLDAALSTGEPAKAVMEDNERRKDLL